MTHPDRTDTHLIVARKAENPNKISRYLLDRSQKAVMSKHDRQILT